MSLLLFKKDYKPKLREAEKYLLTSEGPWEDVYFTSFDVDLGEDHEHATIHTVRACKGTPPPVCESESPVIKQKACTFVHPSFLPSFSSLSFRDPENAAEDGKVADTSASPDTVSAEESQPEEDQECLDALRASLTDGHVHDSPPLVLWPGYGQGAASFWRNLPELAAQHDGAVYACDWLGCGLSSRPDFNCTTPDDAEEWFVESFHAWKTQLGIKRFHLLGHSMGGIIATAFAEKYGDELESLVLASPAGVPHPPPGTFREQLSELPWGYRMIFTTAASFWESGYTPHGVVRSTGSFMGRGILSTYVNRRFQDSVPSKEQFAEYMYQHWQGDSSGEKALQAMLSPGARSKKPLIDRIPKLSGSYPITFIYGSRDWMEVSAAHEIHALMHGSAHPVRVDVVNGAGHQLFIDQPKIFNAFVLETVTRESVRSSLDAEES